MERTSEARFWQTVGVVVGVAGSLLIAYDFAVFGYASIVARALMLGMAGSFLMLAGTAAFVGGRALRMEGTALSATEARLWTLLAGVSMLGGAASVVFAWIQHSAFLLDRIATGLAGGFALMFGIVCLLGQRVMSHMHDALGAAKAEVKAKAAAAS